MTSADPQLNTNKISSSGSRVHRTTKQSTWRVPNICCALSLLWFELLWRLYGVPANLIAMRYAYYIYIIITPWEIPLSEVPVYDTMIHGVRIGSRLVYLCLLKIILFNAFSDLICLCLSVLNRFTSPFFPFNFFPSVPFASFTGRPREGDAR